MAMLAKSAAGHFRRFKGYDYSRGGSIFITATLAERRPLFGCVAHDRVELSDAGEILAAQIERVKGEFPLLEVRALVIMPDHLHLRLTFPPGLAMPVVDIGNFIGRIKQYSQHYIKAAGLCGPGLWLVGYHDHLCLSRFINEQVDKYIANNPLKWHLMHGLGCLRVEEPLIAPGLPTDEWWSGVGNRALLESNRWMKAEKYPFVRDPYFKFRALNVSRSPESLKEWIAATGANGLAGNWGRQVAFAVKALEDALKPLGKEMVVRTWASGASHWLGTEWVHAPGYGGETGEPLSVWGEAKDAGSRAKAHRRADG